MMHSIHCANKDVQLEVGIIPSGVGASDFKENEIEVAVVSKDRAFTFVSYCTRQELELLIERGQEVLNELERQDAENFLKLQRDSA